MAQMKQTADNMNEFRETPYYLMIDELSGKGQITVKYWTTNCEVGNRIQAGVKPVPQRHHLPGPEDTGSGQYHLRRETSPPK